jgi:histidinol-phosphate phosphatase family protein
LGINSTSRAIFFDRDGTLCQDVPYCSRPEDLELLPGAIPAIKTAHNQGYKVVIITNQSGIARRYFTIQGLGIIHEKMQRDLAREGITLDGIFYCPHHPDENCYCRKPQPGLLLRSAAALNINLSSSYMVGNSLSDIQAGKRAGCRTVLVHNKLPEIPDVVPNYFAPDLTSALQWISSDNCPRGKA